MEKTTGEFKIWRLGQVKNTKFGMGVRLQHLSFLSYFGITNWEGVYIYLSTYTHTQIRIKNIEKLFTHVCGYFE